jgi:predicted nuclease of restriction endonuclease-like (RecB) superfamily
MGMNDHQKTDFHKRDCETRGAFSHALGPKGVHSMSKKSPIEGKRKAMLGASKPGVMFPVPETMQNLPENYSALLTEIKTIVTQERIKVVMSANAGLVLMYWHIGRKILQRQQDEGWGTRVIDRLAHDLKTAYPAMAGFSPRNLKYMRKFAQEWPDLRIVQRTVALLPWRSNLTLLDKLDDPETRLWYARKALEVGMGKDMLVIQIETRLHERQGKAIHNFDAALPPADSDMIAQQFKDPYLFDFLGTADPRKEAELEQLLIDHIQRFLLELGQGFAFVGRQVHLEIGDSDFYLDLLFYHLTLRCYVVVELKAGKFEPGHIGQLNLYLNGVDDLLRHPDDKPTIGLLLVKDKNQTVVEYALAGHTKPIGVAQWERQIIQKLPVELETSLPSIEEIEAELSRDLNDEQKA